VQICDHVRQALLLARLPVAEGGTTAPLKSYIKVLSTCDPWGAMQIIRNGGMSTHGCYTDNHWNYDPAEGQAFDQCESHYWTNVDRINNTGSCGKSIGVALRDLSAEELTETAVSTRLKQGLMDSTGIQKSFPTVQSLVDLTDSWGKKFWKARSFPGDIKCDAFLDVMPLVVDVQIPTWLEEIEKVAADTHAKLLQVASDASFVSLRVQSAAKTALALFPITIALLPGFSKGAKQVKRIVPPSPLVGYVLAFMPILQVPLMATVLGMLAQLIGSWGFFVAVWSIMIAQVMPVVGLFRAVGPHEDYKAFVKAKKGPCGFIPVRVCLLLVALGCFVKETVDFFAKSGLASNLGMEDVASKSSLIITTVFGFLLNFMKGKTITTVMSADCLMRMMISLRRFDVVHEKLVGLCSERMLAGMLASLTPKHSNELRAKYDADGDGNFDAEEIKKMVSEVHDVHHSTENKNKDEAE
jgi:hypothetical protein